MASTAEPCPKIVRAPSGGILDPEGEAVLADQFAAAAAAARNSHALDATARLLWRAHAEGQIADADAEAVAVALQGRRAAFARPGSLVAVAHATPASARRRAAEPRSPDRQASLERRRRQAMSGVVPSRIAASFTPGELAVLSVVGRQCQRAGVCSLPVDMVAALAGVSRSTVKNAVRLAVRLGLIERRERRRRGLPSKTNVIKVISAEWSAWLKLGEHRVGVGVKSVTPTVSHSNSRGESGEKLHSRCDAAWRTQAVHGTILSTKVAHGRKNR